MPRVLIYVIIFNMDRALTGLVVSFSMVTMNFCSNDLLQRPISTASRSTGKNNSGTYSTTSCGTAQNRNNVDRALTGLVVIKFCFYWVKRVKKG